MPPRPSESGSAEIWHHPGDQSSSAATLHLGDKMCLDLLLPNGLLIPVQCSTDRSLATLKSDLFVEAKKYPLYQKLQSPSDYIFYTISLSGEKEEFYDESRSIYSLRLIIPVLCLVEPQGNRQEKQLAHDIGIAIGHPLTEIEHGLTDESEAFRVELFRITESCVKERTAPDGIDKYSFAEDFLCSDIRPLPSSSDCLVTVWMRSNDMMDDKKTIGGGEKTTIKCDLNVTLPADIIRMTLKNRYARSGSHRPSLVASNEMEHCDDQYIIKIVGKRLYLTQAVPLSRFSYIRTCIEQRHAPLLMLMSKEAVMRDVSVPWQLIQPSWIRGRRTNNDDNRSICSLWEIDEMFKVRVHSASHINVTDVDLIYTKAALFHGPDILVNRDSKRVSPTNPRWSDSWIDFDFYIPDLPPSAQLCLSVISMKKTKTKEEHLPLGWANLRLMDWRNELLQGKQTLYLWPFPKDFNDNVYPIGQNGSNPNHETIRLEIELLEFNTRVQYPERKQIIQYVDTLKKWKARRGETDCIEDPKRPPRAMLQVFEQAFDRDRQELTDQEEQVLWQMREYAKSRPDILPRLLDAVQWSSREHVAQLYVLLDNGWPQVSPETALELLDIKFSDRVVRAFAVKCLDEQLCDERLQLYLMSLVQALKYEPFGTCDLAKFLLERALKNHRIGHMLFWLIRAELGQGHRLHKRFALILEAYARGVGNYLHTLLKQVDIVDRLDQVSILVKDIKEKEAATRKLQDELRAHVDVMQLLESPLDPTDLLGTLRIEECRVIGSAKMPLRLGWNNPEPLAELTDPTHEIIFKNGDDLRQDMLTLQVLRIMDSIWKAEGYDFCLEPYRCLPMGKNIGMIEVVRKSKTIYEIQCAGSRRTGAFNIGPQFLNKWVRHHNCESNGYLKAVDTFTRSCAGYCVATFVLGIKDRHQDNIMVTEDGRIFHIDFGHFLGHYKKKLGINRDRAPFVLTDHFLAVIAKGKTNYRDSHEFRKFQELCGKAYVILHRHAKLFISLFTMMLSMGIAELERLDDVNYLRRTLSAGMSDEEALAYFQHQLNEAYEGGWMTKTNWLFHSVRHGLQ